MSETILEFIRNQSDLAWCVVFVVAFLESMAIIGLLVPGWLLLVGAGTLIGSEVLSFYPIALSAYLGAVLGEYLSFHLGYHYHQKILQIAFFNRHEKLIEASKVFFAKHGVAGVFIGRFFGPTRAVIPLAAGISEMPKVTFIWVNLLSGLLWAPLYLIPGIMVGAAFKLESGESTQLLIILAVVGGAFALAFKSSYQYWHRHYHEQAIKVVLLKPVLWWAIALTSLLIFIKSPQWELFMQIFRVFVSKL